MTSYFGDEPTCHRCDFPRRLHHLLRVEHECTERPNENAPGAAGTATEGNESDTHQNEGIMNHDTVTPASYLVLIVAAGLQQIVAHASDFTGAVALINADASRRFGWDAIEHTLTTGDYVRMTTFAGLEVEYRIIPHDRPVPEDEPSAEEVDAAELGEQVEELDSVVINSGTGLTATMELRAGSTTVTFSNHPDRLDSPQILAVDIPLLVDALLKMHRTWLYAGGAA